MTFAIDITLLAAFTILFMGVLIVLHNRRSASNVLFFGISLVTVLWSLANYLSLNPLWLPVIWWIRLVLFFAAPHAVLFFLFVHTFPRDEIRMSPTALGVAVGMMAAAMLATLSPFVFSRVEIVDGVVTPLPGPLMVLFAGVVLVSLVGGLTLVVKKLRAAAPEEKARWELMLVGILTSYLLIIITNFLFVVVLRETIFIVLGPLFMLPAIVGMGYALVRHNLLNVKVFATETFVFAILAVTIIQMLISKDIRPLLVRNVLFFSLFIVFGIALIKSVLREVRQREQLERLTAELEKADQLKSQFLSFASHQLKSPLASIRLVAQLVLKGLYGELSELLRKKMGQVEESASRLIRLTDNFLDLRKIEEGHMEYQRDQVTVTALITELVERFQPAAAERKLTLTFEPPPAEITITTDREKLQEVLENLIENALKYTPQGWIKVVLVAGPDAGAIRISVSDSGLGIDAQTLPTLFEQFHRDRKVRNIRGTGLGLYLVKKMIADQGGKVWAESLGQGQGSAFFVELPRN